MTNKTKIGIVFAVAVIAIMGYGYLSQNGSQEVAAATPAGDNGQPEKQYPQAPDFTLNDLDGNAVSLTDFRGKVVIIDFWATWCPPCRKGIPDFVDLQKEFGDGKLVVLGVNLDQGRPDQIVPMVRQFADNYKINYPVLMHDFNIVNAYGGIESIPTTFVVDKDGRVRQGVVGYHPITFFREIVSSLQ
jgi:thiol-disulfide isomerase/thioredoxin